MPFSRYLRGIEIVLPGRRTQISTLSLESPFVTNLGKVDPTMTAYELGSMVSHRGEKQDDAKGVPGTSCSGLRFSK
jgi:hypothetical protein